MSKQSRIDVIGSNGNEGLHYARPTHYASDNDPFRFSLDNGLGVLEHTAIKYIVRHTMKNGVDDINKAIHTLERLKEEVYGQKGKTTET